MIMIYHDGKNPLLSSFYHHDHNLGVKPSFWMVKPSFLEGKTLISGGKAIIFANENLDFSPSRFKAFAMF